MKRSVSLFFAALMTASVLSTGLTGCAISITKGRQISEAEFSSFKKGVTTYDEVRKKLGTPTNMVSHTTQLQLSYAYTHAKGTPLLVSLLTAQKPVTSTNQTITFQFNPKTKILEDILVMGDNNDTDYSYK